MRSRVDLEWVRGLAALFVVLLHAREISWIGIREFWQRKDETSAFDQILAVVGIPAMWGSAGVAVFFVLSGYVIHFSSARQIRENPQWELNVFRFYGRRFVRVYSVLFPALVLTYALDSISESFSPSFIKLGDLSLRTFLLNLFSLQNIIGPHFGSNGPLWTLSIEIHFYLLYPALLFLRRHFSARVLLWISFGFSLISWLLTKNSEHIYFAQYYFSWVLGFCAAEISANRPARYKYRFLGVYSLGFAVSGAAIFFKEQYIAFVLWSIAFYIFLLRASASSATKMPGNFDTIRRGLAFIGVFSYTLYAIHQPIIVAMVSIANGGQKSLSMMFPLIGVMVALIFSYIFYLLFERVSIKWLSRYLR